MQDVETDTLSAWWRPFLRGRHAWDDVESEPLRVVDLFCGSGGFGLGTALAAQSFGRRAVFGAIADADRAATEVHARSLPVRNVLNDSISIMVDHSVDRRDGGAEFDYPPEILDETLAAEIGRTDLLIAGPPCQGHSNLNNHTRRDDPRNDLFVSTVAIAIALGVPAVVIENVPSVTRSHGEVVEIARLLFEREGYAVAQGVMKMDVLGGWQTRARFFMIAIKGGNAEHLNATMRDWASAAGHRPRFARAPKPALWAIDDLQNLAGMTNFDTAPVPGEENARRIAWLFDNKKHNLPNDERPECHREGTTYGSVYGRMFDDRPAPTITTGIGTPGQGRFIHPTQQRLVTPHEAARLQSFPDGYGFTNGEDVPRKLLAKWIGDAVPPFLGCIASGVALSAALGREFEPPWS
ncbi:MAG: DNA cytosine methyltransferase [Paracoccaceae bacterium]